MKRASDVPLMMKGTPCSRGNYAPCKTSSKVRYVTRSTNPAKRVRAWVETGRRDRIEAPKLQRHDPQSPRPQWLCRCRPATNHDLAHAERGRRRRVALLAEIGMQGRRGRPPSYPPKAGRLRFTP